MTRVFWPTIFLVAALGISGVSLHAQNPGSTPAAQAPAPDAAAQPQPNPAGPPQPSAPHSVRITSPLGRTGETTTVRIVVLPR